MARRRLKGATARLGLAIRENSKRRKRFQRAVAAERRLRGGDLVINMVRDLPNTARTYLIEGSTGASSRYINVDSPNQHAVIHARLDGPIVDNTWTNDRGARKMRKTLIGQRAQMRARFRELRNRRRQATSNRRVRGVSQGQRADNFINRN